MLTEINNVSAPVLWKRLLTFGNECFEKKNWLQAQYYYKEAESHLDFLWSADTTNVNLLIAWICSLHNLASVFEKQGNKHEALRCLFIPHQRMLNFTKSKQASEDIKLIAINALKLTFTPIMLFSKRNPICKNCQLSIKTFEHYLESNKEVVH